MTTKAAAIQGFLEGFGLDAFAASSVPSLKTYPYLTYNLVDGAFGDSPAPMEVDLWYYGTGEAEPNAKAQEMAEAIGRGGVILPCDGGGIWVKRGSPFSQAVVDTDDQVRRRMINIDLEYVTAF